MVALLGPSAPLAQVRPFPGPSSEFVYVLASLAFVSLVIVGFVCWTWRKRAQHQGYRGLLAYLRAIPTTDAEKVDAVQLFLKGGVLVALGLFFFPLCVLGLVPLYYGARKLALVLLGVPASSDAPRD